MKTEQFYQDFAMWLSQWIRTNIKNENELPIDFSLERTKIIVIVAFFTFINQQQWPAPQQQTATIFCVSVRTIARAIKKHFT